MAGCGCRYVITYSAWGAFCSTDVNLTIPSLLLSASCRAVPSETPRVSLARAFLNQVL